MKQVLVIVLLIISSCSKNDKNLINSSELEGQWIETKSQLDTLSFESLDNLEIMYLKRGKEMKDGYLLPKLGSGPYRYKVKGEIVSLNWMLSSNSDPNEYYFKALDDKLNIGNFYDSIKGQTLTFEKLK